jgi:hypothetical protein
MQHLIGDIVHLYFFWNIQEYHISTSAAAKVDVGISIDTN